MQLASVDNEHDDRAVGTLCDGCSWIDAARKILRGSRLTVGDEDRTKGYAVDDPGGNNIIVLEVPDVEDPLFIKTGKTIERLYS